MDNSINKYFKSIIDADRQAVVICDLNHTILYMNPSAVTRYAKRGRRKTHWTVTS